MLGMKLQLAYVRQHRGRERETLASVLPPHCKGHKRRTQVGRQVSCAAHAAQCSCSQPSIWLASLASRGAEAADDTVPRKAHHVPVVAQHRLDHLRVSVSAYAYRAHTALVCSREGKAAYLRAESSMQPCAVSTGLQVMPALVPQIRLSTCQ